MSFVQAPLAWHARTAAMLLPLTMLSHAVSLVTPTTITRHHSATPALAVVTTWLWGGRVASAAVDPKTRERSISCGWSTQWPAIGQWRVLAGGVKPIGATT